MADAAEVAIEAALLARAQAFADSQSPAVRIAMPNIAFTPPVVTPTAVYLRATFLPADTLTLSVASGTNQHYGLMQIDVFYAGAGEFAPGRLAAGIISYFKRGTDIARDGFTVHILKAPYRRALSDADPTWAMLPVRIPYTAFAPDPA